tara:strand:- start:5096 stop:5821 length:726 start_codon:yes stop_codon:yes gene_type:complete
MISKNQIKLIKSLRLKKNRTQSGFFIAEGEKIVDELIDSALETVNVFSISKKYKNLKNYISINSTQLKQISNLKSPNNVVGIFKMPKSQEINLDANIVALEDINDPGNLGTIIRLCDWFGIKNIICSVNSVDCYNPKVVQSSMGSICRVSISYMELDNLISNNNYKIVAADLNGKKLREYVFSKKQIIFFGSESNGFSQKVSSKIKDKITIERFNDHVESLNLASSVAIVLSELNNQIIGK